MAQEGDNELVQLWTRLLTEDEFIQYQVALADLIRSAEGREILRANPAAAEAAKSLVNELNNHLAEQSERIVRLLEVTKLCLPPAASALRGPDPETGSLLKRLRPVPEGVDEVAVLAALKEFGLLQSLVGAFTAQVGGEPDYLLLASLAALLGELVHNPVLASEIGSRREVLERAVWLCTHDDDALRRFGFDFVANYCTSDETSARVVEYGLPGIALSYVSEAAVKVDLEHVDSLCAALEFVGRLGGVPGSLAGLLQNLSWLPGVAAAVKNVGARLRASALFSLTIPFDSPLLSESQKNAWATAVFTLPPDGTRFSELFDLLQAQRSSHDPEIRGCVYGLLLALVRAGPLGADLCLRYLGFTGWLLAYNEEELRHAKFSLSAAVYAHCSALQQKFGAEFFEKLDHVVRMGPNHIPSRPVLETEFDEG